MKTIVISSKTFNTAILPMFTGRSTDKTYSPGTAVVGYVIMNVAVPYPSQHPDAQLGNMQDVQAFTEYKWSIQ